MFRPSRPRSSPKKNKLAVSTMDQECSAARVAAITQLLNGAPWTQMDSFSKWASRANILDRMQSEGAINKDEAASIIAGLAGALTTTYPLPMVPNPPPCVVSPCATPPVAAYYPPAMMNTAAIPSPTWTPAAGLVSNYASPQPFAHCGYNTPTVFQQQRQQIAALSTQNWVIHHHEQQQQQHQLASFLNKPSQRQQQQPVPPCPVTPTTCRKRCRSTSNRPVKKPKGSPSKPASPRHGRVPPFVVVKASVMDPFDDCSVLTEPDNEHYVW